METKTKKLLAVLTIIALMLGVLPLSVSQAAEKPNISINSVETTESQEVTVNLTLDQTITTASLSTSVKFDNTKLEVTKIEVGSAISNRVLDKPTVENSNTQSEVMLIAISGSNFDIEPGTLATITFKAKDGVTGKQDLNVVVNEMYTEDYQEISDTVTTTSGTIDIVVPITDVTLNKTTGTLNVSETEDLIETIVPDNTTEDKTVTWTSSDSAIATVENGKVTAVAPGTAIITATVAGISATYTVEVKQPLTGITLNSASENLIKGQEFDLKVTYVPANATDKVTVVWESDDATVATVENGKVTALKEGKAIITATAKVDGTNREYTATCEINVEEIKLNSIALDTKDFELFIGDSKELSVIYDPQNTTDSKDVTWTTSDATVATVENGKVTALKVGTAVITATVGNKEAKVTVTVPAVLIEGIEVTLDKSTIEVNETANLKVTTNPEKVTEEVKAIYSSSDETIATVDANGLIKGVKPGKATITVTVNEKFTEEVEIEVVEKTVEETPETPNTDTEDPEEVVDNEEPSVLPDTGDIAIGVFVVLMVASLTGIVLVVRKQQKNK